jgi:hypothetical protein
MLKDFLDMCSQRPLERRPMPVRDGGGSEKIIQERLQLRRERVRVRKYERGSTESSFGGSLDHYPKDIMMMSQDIARTVVETMSR